MKRYKTPSGHLSLYLSPQCLLTCLLSVSQLKEDLAGQEVDDEGHEEEEEPQEEAQTFQTHTPEEQQDRCATNTRTRSDIHIL